MSLFSHISINPFELDYGPLAVIRDSTDSYCFVDQLEGRVFRGANTLGKYIHERLSQNVRELISNGQWFVELTPESVIPIKPEVLKEALFDFFEVFEKVVYLPLDVTRTEPLDDKRKLLLQDEFRTSEPTVEDMRKLLNRMFTNIAGGVFICEKAIRKGHTVCVTVG